MENTPANYRFPAAKMGKDKLCDFFIEHLNRVCYGKKQLIERLPAMESHAHFKDLQQAIGETIEAVEKQVARMEAIFAILKTEYKPEGSAGLVALLDEAFMTIQQNSADVLLRDMAILFYLQNIESIEMASFKILELVAREIDNADISQMLTECYDEAEDDKALLYLISSRYVSG